MADGRERNEWGRAASLAARVAQPWVPEVIDVLAWIPERYRPVSPPPPERTPEQKRHDTRCALAIMGAHFGDPNPLG